MNGLISISSAQIQLWFAFYDDIAEESLHSAYRALLSESEKEQESRFCFAKDRRRYLVTRALVRTVLSRYVPIPPTNWIFSTNAYGCPRIVNAEGKRAGLSFNISHTDSLIVLGVSKYRALGVDVENLRSREAMIDIANRYFAPQEVALLAATPQHRQQYRFFEYWTFKEAYIKARAMGLCLPLDKFSFHYPDDHAVEITIHPELADNSARWQFWQFRPASEYLLAICAERIGREFPAVTAKRVIPMLRENDLALELMRSSLECQLKDK